MTERRGTCTSSRAGARTELARSEGFSVAAYPSEIGFTFFSLMQPVEVNGVKVWGARYTLTVASDSGVRGDLDRTKIAENVFVKSATGLFKGAENRHSDFKPTTGEAARPPRHRHGRQQRRRADRGDQEGRA